MTPLEAVLRELEAASPLPAEEWRRRKDVSRALKEHGTPLQIVDLGDIHRTAERLLSVAGATKPWIRHDRTLHPAVLQLLQNMGFGFVVGSEAERQGLSDAHVSPANVSSPSVAPPAFAIGGGAFDKSCIALNEDDVDPDELIDSSRYLALTDVLMFEGMKHVLIDSRWDDRIDIARDRHGGYGLFAKRPLEPGELAYAITGRLSRKRTFTSIQVSAELHLEPGMLGAHTNHSCNPSAGVKDSAVGGYDVFALRFIAAGEAVTVDYATFESAIVGEGLNDCRCGDSICRRAITGWGGLPDERKRHYGAYVARHLLGGG